MLGMIVRDWGLRLTVLDLQVNAARLLPGDSVYPLGAFFPSSTNFMAALHAAFVSHLHDIRALYEAAIQQKNSIP